MFLIVCIIVSWSIFDSKSTEENFTLYPILFKDLITSDNFLEDGELCIEVLDIFVSMNAFAVYVTGKHTIFLEFLFSKCFYYIFIMT